MFSGRAAAFREACYGLFGYRVDMDSAAAPPGAAGEPPATTFTLKPMHADDAKARACARDTTLGLTQDLVLPCGLANSWVVPHPIPVYLDLRCL